MEILNDLVTNGRKKTGARELNTFYEPTIARPMDARMVVETLADLYNENTWITRYGEDSRYLGMIVSVANDPVITNNGIYQLIKYEQRHIKEGWQKSSAGGSGGGKGGAISPSYYLNEGETFEDEGRDATPYVQKALDAAYLGNTVAVIDTDLTLQNQIFVKGGLTIDSGATVKLDNDFAGIVMCRILPVVIKYEGEYLISYQDSTKANDTEALHLWYDADGFLKYGATNNFKYHSSELVALQRFVTNKVITINSEGVEVCNVRFNQKPLIKKIEVNKNVYALSDCFWQYQDIVADGGNWHYIETNNLRIKDTSNNIHMLNIESLRDEYFNNSLDGTGKILVDCDYFEGAAVTLDSCRYGKVRNVTVQGKDHTKPNGYGIRQISTTHKACYNSITGVVVNYFEKGVTQESLRTVGNDSDQDGQFQYQAGNIAGVAAIENQFWNNSNEVNGMFTFCNMALYTNKGNASSFYMTGEGGNPIAYIGDPEAIKCLSYDMQRVPGILINDSNENDRVYFNQGDTTANDLCAGIIYQCYDNTSHCDKYYIQTEIGGKNKLQEYQLPQAETVIVNDISKKTGVYKVTLGGTNHYFQKIYGELADYLTGGYIEQFGKNGTSYCAISKSTNARGGRVAIRFNTNPGDGNQIVTKDDFVSIDPQYDIWNQSNMYEEDTEVFFQGKNYQCTEIIDNQYYINQTEKTPLIIHNLAKDQKITNEAGAKSGDIVCYSYDASKPYYTLKNAIAKGNQVTDADLEKRIYPQTLQFGKSYVYNSNTSYIFIEGSLYHFTDNLDAPKDPLSGVNYWRLIDFDFTNNATYLYKDKNNNCYHWEANAVYYKPNESDATEYSTEQSLSVSSCVIMYNDAEVVMESAYKNRIMLLNLDDTGNFGHNKFSLAFDRAAQQITVFGIDASRVRSGGSVQNAYYITSNFLQFPIPVTRDYLSEITETNERIIDQESKTEGAAGSKLEGKYNYTYDFSGSNITYYRIEDGKVDAQQLSTWYPEFENFPCRFDRDIGVTSDNAFNQSYLKYYVDPDTRGDSPSGAYPINITDKYKSYAQKRNNIKNGIEMQIDLTGNEMVIIDEGNHQHRVNINNGVYYHEGPGEEPIEIATESCSQRIYNPINMLGFDMWSGNYVPTSIKIALDYVSQFESFEAIPKESCGSLIRDNFRIYKTDNVIKTPYKEVSLTNGYILLDTLFTFNEISNSTKVYVQFLGAMSSSEDRGYSPYARINHISALPLEYSTV